MKGGHKALKTLNFTYDPLALMRIVLQRHVEETIQGKFYKAKQFACYEYLAKMSDEALEELLCEYTKRHKLEAITLEDWRQEGKLIFDIIFEKPEYQQLELNFKKMGFGETGLGVFDIQGNKFYDCHPVCHWETIQRLISETYPEYEDALREMYVFDDLDEYDGITRAELEGFIMGNFQLIGENKSLDSYL